jgi:hypothetical protein
MSGHAGKKDKCATRIQNAIRRSYDAKFKVTVINYAEKTNNCSAARKLGVAEANVRRWREQKQKLRNAKCIQKSFQGPKHGGFQELEKKVVEFVCLKRKTGVPITRETIKYKARELCKSHITQHHFKASSGWCVRIMRRNGFSLRRRTSLCHRLAADFEEKLDVFQRHEIGLRKKHSHLLSQIRTSDETPVYFDTSPNFIVDDTGAKFVADKTSGHEKMRVTVMLVLLADGSKLPP